MASATGSFLSLPCLSELPADVLHDDEADRVSVPVLVFDEVEDLHDLRVNHLGEELPFGHRDRLRLGVTGMHQALEDHRAVVDVVVDRQVHPAQAAVRDAALDLVLVGDDVSRIQLRQKRIRAAAGGAPALLGVIGPLGALTRPADRLSAVPAEPLGLRHHRVGHQGLERVDVAHPGDLDQAAAEVPDRRQHSRPHRHPVVRLAVQGAQRDVRKVVVIVVEIGTEQRLGGLDAPRRRVAALGVRRLGARAHVFGAGFGLFGLPATRPSVHVPRCGRGGCGSQHRQPLAVQRVPRAVPADPLQGAVDEPHQFGVVRLTPMP